MPGSMAKSTGMLWSSASERRERSLRVLNYEEMDCERPYP